MKGHRHHQPSSSVDDDEEIEIEDDDDDDDEEELTRDEFNLNKIILAVTRPGKVRQAKQNFLHLLSFCICKNRRTVE